MKDYYEELWQRLPDDLTMPDKEVRLAYLRGEVRPGDRVLDLGFGSGWATAELARMGAAPIGIEVAEAAVRRARERHPELEFRPAPFDGPLPLEDGSFDVAWASEVIEHVADTARWLSEVRRVLAPGRPASRHHAVARLAAGRARRGRALLAAAWRSPAPVHAGVAADAARRVRVRGGLSAASPARRS